MRFLPTPLDGCLIVEPAGAADDRGLFARTHCEATFAAHGLTARFAQSSVSWNIRAGTVRGMHLQRAPHAETKLVRCVRGAIHDVVVDLRPGSPTCGRTFGADLTARNRLALYVPPGLAHGFQTLEDDTEVLYMIDPPYAPGHGDGVRWNDPAFAIRWPGPVTVIAPRDLAFPDWTRP